ncbi:MAG: hypothetical protein RLZZ15_4386 [Verrucomicrobiota bacterium]|jgi:hypothetical protein
MPTPPRFPWRPSRLAPALLAFAMHATLSAAPGLIAADDLARGFTTTVRPFLERYCVSCHGDKKPEAELNLAAYDALAAVTARFDHWDLVLDRIASGEMPSDKAKEFPSDAARRDVVAWIKAARAHEVAQHAGDPGPVSARRLSHAEYDHTIRDLTGVDLRPTREFPVDPANQAGFDNSGESLAMSPALLKKYLGAARTVAEHLVLQPDGFAFAPHPVVADTDRDKYAVLRIVEFYRRQPTDYAEYFLAAWRHRERAALGRPAAALADFAAAARLSASYLATVAAVLTDTRERAGPIAKLQAMWRDLPPATAASGDEAPARRACEQMRDYVLTLRAKLVPEVKNLSAGQTGIQGGAQALVLWKNRAMAANRRRYAPGALLTSAEAAELEKKHAADLAAAAKISPAKNKAPAKPSPNSDTIQRGGKFLAPALATAGTSATTQMAAVKNRGVDPELVLPDVPAERARTRAAFARFAEVFPDAFYITERARVYLDAAKETGNSGRLLSAGLHSMTGYFRDDGPLAELVLDDAGRRELDRLWAEFEFLALVPQRMHASLLWFERTDSSYLRDDQFAAYRPEDKSSVSPEKLEKFAALYLAKAQRNGASEAVAAAIREHFAIVARDIARVDAARLAAEPAHLAALADFAARAYRRPLTTDERAGLLSFYHTARHDHGGDHEEAMRDSIAGVLLSPHFSYRVARLAGGAGATTGAAAIGAAVKFPPLSDYALASRLSYFLWASMPDAELLALAAAGRLHEPAVLVAQTRRLLRDPRNRNFAAEFLGHWLDFRRFEEHNAVDRERFPAFDHELRAAMFEEPLRFFTDLIARDGSVRDFLHADHTFVNAPLARHYGLVGVAPAPGEWVRVDRAGEVGRGGLLPMAVFLTANSPGLRTSPVKRGYWVVRRLLGERIPPPPATVAALPADEKDLGALTLRETLARHRADKACAGCHARFDAFGLAFEGYGAIGERRAVDFGGRPVDARAEFPGGTEGVGLAGLRDHIGAQREGDFLDTLCRRLLAYGLGRSLIPSDDALVATMRARLAAEENRFGALVETIVTSPQFLTKRASAEATASLR